MKREKMIAVFLAGMVLTGCLGMNAGAFDLRNEAAEVQVAGSGNGVARATGSFNMDVAANSIVAGNSSFPMDAGETVTINASYTPRWASVDFGLVDDDGIFYYLTVSNGSINKTLEIETRGHYTLAVRNNSTDPIRVSGFVSY